MAGTITATPSTHRGGGWRPRLTSVKVTLTCDASGNATATDIGPVFGRLAGVIFYPDQTGLTPPNITIKDKVTGATLLSYNAATVTPSPATTGDTTGGAFEDLWTASTHGLVDGDRIFFSSITGNGAGGPSLNTAYYVDQKTSSTFLLCTDAGLSVVQNVGATDASAAVWYKYPLITSSYRPTANIADNAGVAISAATSSPNVNRDIFVAGTLTAECSSSGNAAVHTLTLAVVG